MCDFSIHDDRKRVLFLFLAQRIDVAETLVHQINIKKIVFFDNETDFVTYSDRVDFHC